MYIEKVEELKQQLAEKEKELTRLKKNWNNSRTQQRRLYTELNKKYRDLVEDDYYKGWEIMGLNMDIENLNQDKISFCIEQLEKVKERVKNIKFHGLQLGVQQLIKVSVFYEIDNQIKQLKEMK